MRRHGLKKGLSLLLVLCMILSLLPMTALAEEISEPAPEKPGKPAKAKPARLAPARPAKLAPVRPAKLTPARKARA